MKTFKKQQPKYTKRPGLLNSETKRLENRLKTQAKAIEEELLIAAQQDVINQLLPSINELYISALICALRDEGLKPTVIQRILDSAAAYVTPIGDKDVMPEDLAKYAKRFVQEHNLDGHLEWN